MPIIRAIPALAQPIDPTTKILTLESPSTPNALKRYRDAKPITENNPPISCCHHGKFNEATADMSQAVALWTLFGTDFVAIDRVVKLARFNDRYSAAVDVFVH